MKIVSKKTRKALRRSVKKVVKKHGPKIASGLAAGVASSLATLASTTAAGTKGKKSNLTKVSRKVTRQVSDMLLGEGKKSSNEVTPGRHSARARESADVCAQGGLQSLKGSCSRRPGHRDGCSPQPPPRFEGRRPRAERPDFPQYQTARNWRDDRALSRHEEASDPRTPRPRGRNRAHRDSRPEIRPKATR